MTVKEVPYPVNGKKKYSVLHNGKEYSCMPTIINDYEKGTTAISMKTLEDLRYIVTGSVNYNVMRG